MSPIENKDEGRNKNREGRKDVSFTASISCAHCEQHSGLCITENTQHGTQTCPSWRYHTASLMWGCKSWAVSIPQDLWLPTSALRLSPPKGMCSRCPHSHFLPHFHSMNMHLTVTNSFFWCLSDVFLLNLKWHFPACFLSLSLLSAAFTNQKTLCLQGLRCSTTLSATFSLLWSLALPHSISQHRFCCFSLSHSPDLIASTSRSPSKITIWHWFPFQQLF